MSGMRYGYPARLEPDEDADLADMPSDGGIQVYGYTSPPAISRSILEINSRMLYP